MGLGTLFSIGLWTQVQDLQNLLAYLIWNIIIILNSINSSAELLSHEHIFDIAVISFSKLELKYVLKDVNYYIINILWSDLMKQTNGN